ncbi:MAG: phosphatase PAP2 family protein [Chloroflexota bacterium]
MDFILANGIDWVVAIQSLGGWLELPMRFFTFLGSENFFFLILPLVYWSIDAGLGLRVGFVLVTSNSLNSIFKVVFASPRPYWVSTRVIPMSVETSFGVPSGHAQNAMAMWGIMAHGLQKRWAWIIAIALSLLIGFSRLYLGMHFVQDVLVGWLIGGSLLLGFITLWDSVSSWVLNRSLMQQIVIAFVISLILIGVSAWNGTRLGEFVISQEWMDNALRAGAAPDPVSLEGFLTSAGSFFGLAAGAAWIASRGGYQASGPLEKRAFRYAIGLIGILILWMGLGEVFPRDPNIISYVLRYFRYTLVGFWVTGGAPWLFFHFKLTDKPNI